MRRGAARGEAARRRRRRRRRPATHRLKPFLNLRRGRRSSDADASAPADAEAPSAGGCAASKPGGGAAAGAADGAAAVDAADSARQRNTLRAGTGAARSSRDSISTTPTVQARQLRGSASAQFGPPDAPPLGRVVACAPPRPDRGAPRLGGPTTLRWQCDAPPYITTAKPVALRRSCHRASCSPAPHPSQRTRGYMSSSSQVTPTVTGRCKGYHGIASQLPV